MNWLGELVAKQVEPTDTVLDLGCGNLCTTGRLGAFHLAVDGYAQYLDAIKDSGPTMFGFLPFAVERFVGRSYDVVLLLDVLEHLHEGFHREVVEGAERIARKKVIVFSPEGFMPQEAFDAWGMGHNELQAHVSEVYAKDFAALGYAITLHQNENSQGHRCTAFLGIKTI